MRRLSDQCSSLLAHKDTSSQMCDRALPVAFNHLSPLPSGVSPLYPYKVTSTILLQ